MKDFNADKAREIADNFPNEDFMAILKKIIEAAFDGAYMIYVHENTPGIALYLLHLRGFEIIKPLSGNMNIISWSKK